MGKTNRRTRKGTAERRHGRTPDIPTGHYPGSVAKLDVMAGRLARGESLFHPADARAKGDEDTVPTRTERLTYSGSKRVSEIKSKVPGKPHEWVHQRKVTSYILTGRQWQRVAKLISLRSGLDKRQQKVAMDQHRNAINGCLYVLYRGVRWAEMPERYSYFGLRKAGHRVNRVYNNWRTSGRWVRMMRAAGVVDVADRIVWHKLQRVTVQGK